MYVRMHACMYLFLTTFVLAKGKGKVDLANGHPYNK